MSALRVLLHGARLSVFQPTSATAIDLKGWIANQNYFIDVDIQKSDFILRVSDPDEVKRALANDLNRMAIAAFESAAGVATEMTLPRSLAWGSIRSYYASFFAAHAFMRLYGTACSQLDSEHVNAIYKSATMFGKTGGLTSLESGFYSIEIDSNFATIRFRKLKDSHKDTWAVFLALIKLLDANIPSTTALSKHKVEASSLLTELQTGITQARCSQGNWLSAMRNSINYRLTHGVWFPYSAKVARIELLDSASRNWLNTPSYCASISHQGELDSFFGITALIVSLLRELVTAAAQLSDPLNPVMKNGCLRLLNDIRAIRPQREAGTA